MGYERAMDAVLDIAVRMQSIQEVVGKVRSIVELLAAQINSPTIFVPGWVEDLSELEEVSERFDEVD